MTRHDYPHFEDGLNWTDIRYLGSTKGWQCRELETRENVFVWVQDPFWKATENGGFSMSAGLLDELPLIIDTIFAVSRVQDGMYEFHRDQFENDAVVVDGDSDIFNNVAPEKQFVVDMEDNRGVYDIPQELEQ